MNYPFSFWKNVQKTTLYNLVEMSAQPCFSSWKKLLDFHRYPQKYLFSCYDGTQLSQIAAVCPASPPRMQCLSWGWLQATSCLLTRPPATLLCHARELSSPLPMEISLLIHGAAVTAALLWKMMRAEGLLQKEPIFPLHLGSGNPNNPLEIQSVTHCSLNEPLCPNTSFSLSHGLVYASQTHSYCGRGAFDNNAD